ncbi:MAG: hypothetical protein JWQ58_1193, partial [Reyranella sp.]|nr:hypothetical protein [Reyranella sp.]
RFARHIDEAGGTAPTAATAAARRLNGAPAIASVATVPAPLSAARLSRLSFNRTAAKRTGAAPAASVPLRSGTAGAWIPLTGVGAVAAGRTRAAAKRYRFAGEAVDFWEIVED